MKKNLLNLKTMVAALCIALSVSAHAFTAVTSGNWSSAATWGGVAPGSSVINTDIIIPIGITVNMDMDVAFTGLLNTFSVAGSLTSTTNNNLSINQGIFAGNGTIAIRRIVFAGLTTANFTGTLNVNQMVNTSPSLAFIAFANISDSLVLETGTLMLNTNSNVNMLANSTIRIANGAFGGGSILNTNNSYNLMYVGTSKTAGIELNSSTLQNVIVKMNSNSETITLANNATFNSNLNLIMGRIDFSGRQLTLKGDVSMSANTSLVSNSTSELVVEGTGNVTSPLVFATGSNINNITINRSGTVKLASAQTVYGYLNLMKGTLSLETGAALNMNTGSTISVEAGSITTNFGTFGGSNSYNVTYMGSVNANSGIELSGTGLNNVAVNYTTTSTKVTLGSNVSVGGSLNMINGHMDLNGKNITLNGTLSQNANSMFIGNTNSEMNLLLTSATNATLYFDNSSTTNNTLSKLKMNVAGTAALMLGSRLVIQNELNFVKGKLMLDNSDLVIASTGTITGYNDTRYIATSGTGTGRLQMNVTSGGSFVTFPVGTMGNYSPAYIQQTNAGTTGNIMIKAMNDVLTAGYAGFSIGSLSAVSRTWFIEAEQGVTVNMNMKLGWAVLAEANGFNRTNAMIRHYTNNTWDTYAAASASTGANSTFELSRTGVTSLSPFAVADSNAPLKVGEISNTVQFEMYPNPAKDIIILNTSSTEAFKYKVIDISGKVVLSSENTGNSAKINISDLQQGYYFVKITNSEDNTTVVKRFIKE